MSLTVKDLNQIQKLIEAVIEQKTGPRIAHLEERINELPTRSEFLNAMNQIMDQLKDMREDNTILTHRNSNHETRIVRIEKQLKLA